MEGNGHSIICGTMLSHSWRDQRRPWGTSASVTNFLAELWTHSTWDVWLSKGAYRLFRRRSHDQVKRLSYRITFISLLFFIFVGKEWALCGTGKKCKTFTERRQQATSAGVISVWGAGGGLLVAALKTWFSTQLLQTWKPQLIN
jgi:hypothetical protein